MFPWRISETCWGWGIQVDTAIKFKFRRRAFHSVSLSPCACVLFWFRVSPCPRSLVFTTATKDNGYVVRTTFVLRSVSVFFPWHRFRVGPTPACWHIAPTSCRPCVGTCVGLCCFRVGHVFFPCWSRVGPVLARIISCRPKTLVAPPVTNSY